MDPGDRVFDREDDDPDPAVVVAVPEGKTLADWSYEVAGEAITAAAANPEYPAAEQLVLVAFETVLDEAWSGWEDAAPEELFDGVKAYGVTHYGFPEDRLGYRTPPTALEAVVARVAPEVDAVEWHRDHHESILTLNGPRPEFILTEAELADIEQSTLFIWGTDDPFGGPDVGRALVDVMPDAVLEELEAGHLPWLDHPETCGELVSEFLQKNQSGSA